MIPYLVLAVTPLIFVPLVNAYYKTSINEDKKAQKTYLFLCGAMLFLIIALRDKEVGSTDSLNYYNNWKTLSKLDFSKAQDIIKNHKMEPGYLYTVWVLSHIFPHPQWVFVFSGLFFTISVCRFIYINSDNVVMSIMMYICLGLYTFMVQGLRQSVAMSICLFAIEHAKKRNPIKFAILMLIACFFHRSSIVFILTYFLFWKEFTIKVKLQLLVAAALILISTPLFVRYGNEIVDREYGQTVDSGGFIFLATYLIILLVAFLFIPVQNEQAEKRLLKYKVDQKSFFLAITMLGCCFYFMRYIGTLALERISFYFMFGQLITLPYVTKNFDRISKMIINMAVIILSMVLFIYRLSGSDLVPYQFFWQ